MGEDEETAAGGSALNREEVSAKGFGSSQEHAGRPEVAGAGKGGLREISGKFALSGEHGSFVLLSREKEKVLEIARNLIDVLDDETIAEKTGLGVEDVARLCAELL